MKVKIMTDTNSGISVAEGRDLGIEVLPMPVIVGGKVRTEGVDIDQETLYQALENDVPVSTSQPAPAQITDMWDRILAEGADSLPWPSRSRTFPRKKSGKGLRRADMTPASISVWIR